MRKVNRIMGAATVSLFATAGLDMGCAGATAALGGAGAVKGGLDAAKGMGDGVAGQAKGMAKGQGSPDKDGDDNDRLHAVEADFNKPLDDKIDFKNKDKDDWRKFNLIGKPGTATFELHWDEDKAELNMDVFNENGTLVGKSPPRLEGQSTKRILMKVDRPGLYYVKVSGSEKKDTSIYTVSVRWDGAPKKGDKGEGDSGAAAQNDKAAADKAASDKAASDKAAADKAAADKAAATGANGQPGQPGQPGAPVAPIPFAQDPTKVVANIVGSYKEAGVWTLQLDKGSAMKLRTGLTGNLLEGPEGDKLVEGASITINTVLDGNKALAKSFMKQPPGKNKRVVINLK